MLGSSVRKGLFSSPRCVREESEERETARTRLSIPLIMISVRGRGCRNRAALFEK
jgi:hypothetical protein